MEWELSLKINLFKCTDHCSFIELIILVLVFRSIHYPHSFIFYFQTLYFEIIVYYNPYFYDEFNSKSLKAVKYFINL